MLYNVSRLLSVPALMFLAQTASAHSGDHSGGLLATLIHTVSELDHLLGAAALALLLAFVHWRRRTDARAKPVEKRQSDV